MITPRTLLAGALFLSIAMLFPAIASAHQPGTSSVLLKVAPSGELRGEVHVADVDLAAIELMLRQRARRNDIPDTPVDSGGKINLVLAKDLSWLRLSAGGAEVSFTPSEPEVAVTDSRIHTMIRFTADVSQHENLVVSYVDFFEFDPKHKVVTSLEAGGETKVGLLSYNNPRWEVALRAPGALGQFAKFTWEGVWHIWIGIDHILFLLALLLPAVLHYENGRWHPVGNFREALINVLKVVTAFTVAHSVTLSLAALHLVTLPAKFVESVIALSVLLAALNNIWPVVRDRTWMVAFGFGLIHGFGFANVLADLALPAGTLAIALVSFNIGVELGQLAIVAVFFPLAFLVRRRGFYQPVKLRFGSALISVIALGWIVQRVFEVNVMPF
ncbi:MAG: HupE/UreJ family protein [Opitutaceae bacterium]